MQLLGRNLKEVILAWFEYGRLWKRKWRKPGIKVLHNYEPLRGFILREYYEDYRQRRI